jgi:6-phosphogluconolactonase
MTQLHTHRFAHPAELEAALLTRLERSLTDPAAANTAVMLSGGHTPLPVYRALAARRPRPAQGVRVLFSDERYVPMTSPSSNYFQTRELIDTLDLPDSAVLRVRTELPLQEAAADYARQIEALFAAGVPIALGLLGLGVDGHTASLFDGAQLAAAQGRTAIAVQRPDGLAAVSVTPAVLARVQQLVFVVAGEDKQSIARAFLAEDSQLTARRAIASRDSAELWLA